MQPCSVCHRRFAQDRCADHEQACQASKRYPSNSTHRYHYDSQMHRWKGLQYGTGPNPLKAKRPKEAISFNQHFPKTHWKEKHQYFQAAIKGQSTFTNDAHLMSYDRPHQCSLCQRRFATENAISRHQKGCAGNRRTIGQSRGGKHKKDQQHISN